jgi:hypothetical protein
MEASKSVRALHVLTLFYSMHNKKTYFKHPKQANLYTLPVFGVVGLAAELIRSLMPNLVSI